MDEIVKDFLIESSENLDRLDQELVKLESSPSSKELLASIFRTIHTIKGSCGFLGFGRLEKLAHAGESLLARLRDGELKLTAEITSGLLTLVDAVRQMLAAIESTGEDGEDDYGNLITRLACLQDEAGETPGDANGGPSLPALEKLASHAADSSAGQLAGGANALVAEPSEIGGPPNPAEVREEEQRPRAEGLEAGGKETGETPSSRRTAKAEDLPATMETIRVGVKVLDRLMNLVGELVLARNQLLQFSSSRQDSGFQAVCQRMNLITTELQEEVMKTRMQPIGNVWDKFPRTVRDLALACGKDVRLEMEGHDTELDRTIIEAIKDPLTHLVRNSIDHGIEAPEARKQAGKVPTGVIKLRAFHDGGLVNIEVSDDGAGLHLERVRQKAVERGLASAQYAGRMSDRELFHIACLPGFSTAERVTNVSGRGVGLDVVKTKIEEIGGTVDVQSAAGKGMTVKIKIPLTLAIMPALMVTAGGERFAIPQASLRELVRIEAGESAKGLENVHKAPVYRLRGRLLPVVRLCRELQLGSNSVGNPADTAATNIVVVQADGREFGLIVDEITDTQEIVVKPLSQQLRGITAYSGATIMGDGRVALILDILGLAERAHVVSQSESAAGEKRGEASRGSMGAVDSHQQSLLVVQCGRGTRMAIPVPLVSRLEEFPKSAIEFAGAQEVIQYRGTIMPLLRMSGVAGRSSAEAAGNDPEQRLQVVVYTERSRSVGLVVDQIVDIVDEKVVVENPAPRRGLLGSLVVEERVTDLLDVPALVREAIPSFAEPAASA